MTTAADLDLGDFEDDAKAATPKPEVVGAAIEGDDDLSTLDIEASGPYPPAPTEDVTLAVLDELAPKKTVETIMADAKLAALTPKPTLKEMIFAICDAANRIEDGQKALLNAGIRTEPYVPFMRAAAVLDAAQRFLVLIETRQDAVKRVLRGG